MRLAFLRLTIYFCGSLLALKGFESLELRPKVRITPLPYNAESRLALKQKIRLSESGLYELELIPGVSDQLGLSILEKKAKIIAKAETLAPKMKHTSLELVKGIGVKKAQAFGKYLLPE